MRQLSCNLKLTKRFNLLIVFLNGLTILFMLFFGTITILATTVEDRMDNFIYNEKKPEKVVYLTFDDGPSRYTLELLDLLDEYDVPAIFFVIGENIDTLPNAEESLNEMIERGHYIGMHSMTHNMDKLYNVSNAPQNFVNEMLEVREKIKDLTGGFESNLCRPPFGGRTHFKAGHYEALENAKLECIDWNVDSLDWSKSSTDQIFNQVVADFKHNEYPDEVILLFHEKELTLQVLPRIIEYYRNLGYVFIPYYEGEEFKCMKK